MIFLKKFFCFLLFIFCDCLVFPAENLKVKDELGRVVKIPKKVERILSLQPEITRIFICVGRGEKLVGKDYFVHKHDHIFKIIFPEGGKLPAVSRSGSDVNLEALLKLSPDLIFTSPTEKSVLDKIEKSTNIPVLALSSMGRFEKLENEIKLIGLLTGKNKRAEELIEYFRSKINFIRKRISTVDFKPKVYLSFWSSLTRTPVYYEPVNVAGGINVAEGLIPSYTGTLGTVVNLESIIKWNPDIILIHGNYPPEERVVTVKDILSDGRLSSVKAVNKKRIYYTFGFWFWWDPAEVLFETLYLSKLFYPSSFMDMDLKKEGREIFKVFYNSEKAFDILYKKLKCDEW